MLTETQVRTAKPGNCARKLFDARGLYLHVMPNGGKYWRFNFRFKGKYKTLSLGVYPDVPLAKARDRHQKARRLLADKVDPCVEKKASSYTFETVAREWHEHWKATRHERHAHYVLKRLETDVFPAIGSLPLEDLQASDFRDAVLKIERRGALDIRERSRGGAHLRQRTQPRQTGDPCRYDACAARPRARARSDALHVPIDGDGHVRRRPHRDRRRPRARRRRRDHRQSGQSSIGTPNGKSGDPGTGCRVPGTVLLSGAARSGNAPDRRAFDIPALTHSRIAQRVRTYAPRSPSRRKATAW